MDKENYSEQEYPHQQETYTVIGISMEVHNELGPGLLEVVYKEALEWEFRQRGIPYERERKYPVHYKNTVLPHMFIADFVVYDSVILEVKAQKRIIEEHIEQTINYLSLSKLKVGLVLNFGEHTLKFKRVIF